MIRKFYEADDPFARGGDWHPPKPITGEDVAALLHEIHVHGGYIADHINYIRESNSNKFTKIAESTVYYEESQLLKVLEALGLPAPVWKKSMSVEEWKKSRQ